MYGDSIGGIIGTPDLFFMSDGFGDNYADYADLFFQTVFAATAATIVSGAMAERTEFKAYLIFSIVITVLIYPISGHWTWGGGWLSQLGIPRFCRFIYCSLCWCMGWFGWCRYYRPSYRKIRKKWKAKCNSRTQPHIGSIGCIYPLVWMVWI